MKQVSTTISTEDYLDLNILAKDNKQTKRALMREAIALYLKAVRETDKPKPLIIIP